MAPVLRRCFLSSALLGCALVPVFAFWRPLPWSDPAKRYESLIVEAAERARVDPALLRAIAWHESRFDARKIQDGAYGLMQIGRGTGMEWAAVHRIENFLVTDLLDARTNLHVGAWYLGQGMQRWAECDEPATFALAEYHAGAAAVRDWAGDSRKAEDLWVGMRGTLTGDYVARVLRHKH